jgi:hypothetical protein
MKTPDQILADVERRLLNTWARCVADPADPASPSVEMPEPTSLSTDPPAEQDGGPSTPWPHAFPLGQLPSTRLAADFTAAADLAATWRAWSSAHGTSLRTRTRRVHNTDQQLPTHLIVADVDQAARLCGSRWLQRLERGRQRVALLAGRFPHLAEVGLLSGTVAAVDELSDVDFDLLSRAGVWFASHDATGLTPRQVPIEGLHAKWLNNRLGLIRRLSARDELGLLPTHPPRVHFTYLDPAHLAAGARRHDSATIGDRALPAYRPRVVVISENKDTAIHFPELDGGVSVEGVGRGGATIAALPWLTAAEHIFYWGDMDADGLEILNEFRAAGIPATSLFMDVSAFAQWERFGTNVDVRGRPLQARTPRPVPFLTEPEADLYQCLTSDDWSRHRRVEQERIPLDVAVSAVRRIMGDTRAMADSPPARMSSQSIVDHRVEP